MTLAPIHSSEIRGIEGPPGEVPRICTAPGCLRVARDRHHMWSRSYLRGQPVEWVLLPDGRIVQNTTGLCVEHHSMVTGEVGGHKATILYQDATFYWCELGNWAGQENWEIQGPLQPQPPASGETHDLTEHTDLGEGDSCPTCGYQKPKRRTPGAKRPVSSWGVAVPDDTEIGAEVLDEWVDNFAALLGFGQEPSRLRRYHVLAVILAWAAQNKPALIEDIIESQSR